MVAFLIALQGPVLRYDFAPGTERTYRMSVDFDGFLPVFGGKQAKANAAMTVIVKGLAITADADMKTSSEITAMKVVLNGATMPLNEKNVSAFFPKTTIEFSRYGAVTRSDAPDTKLPVRLPGLDAKRFPEISYLPIELAKEAVTVGKEYAFSRKFGDSLVNYRVVPTAISQTEVVFDVKLQQEYVEFEDSRCNPISEADATVKVSTTVEATGSATFDMRRGSFRSVRLVAKSKGEATDKLSSARTRRDLTTIVSVDQLIK